MVVHETNSITGETRQRLSYVELGQIVLKKYGKEACKEGYNTDDPEWVGQPDGRLN